MTELLSGPSSFCGMKSPYPTNMLSFCDCKAGRALASAANLFNLGSAAAAEAADGYYMTILCFSSSLSLEPRRPLE